MELAIPTGLQLAERWSVPIDEWEAASGAECHLVEVDFDADTTTAAVPSTAALAVVPLRLIPELLASERIAPLPEDDPAYPRAVWEDVLRGLRFGIAQPGGQPMLIPVSCPVLAVYFRADLLEQAGLTPPETWSEYQQLLEKLPEWGGGLPAYEPWSEDFRSTMYLCRAVPYALHPDNLSVTLDVQTADPLLAEPPYIVALEDSQKALQRLDPASLTMDPDACFRAVVEGRAAMAIGAPALRPGDGSESDGPARADNIRIGTVALPGADRVYHRQNQEWMPVSRDEVSRVVVAGWGGFAVCAQVHSSQEDRTAAWRLWEALHTPDAESEPELPFGRAICRTSEMTAAMRGPEAGLEPAEWRKHLESTAGLLQRSRVVFDFPFPQQQRFREQMAARLTAAIRDGQAAEDALTALVADWNGLIEELGRGHVLDVYRQCHGLQPLPNLH